MNTIKLNKLFFTISIALFATIYTSYGQIPNYIDTAGLIGYYPFKVDTRDISKYHHNTTNNNVVLTHDSVSYFNGSNAYLDLGFAQDTAKQFSVSVWVKTSDGGTVINNSVQSHPDPQPVIDFDNVGISMFINKINKKVFMIEDQAYSSKVGDTVNYAGGYYGKYTSNPLDTAWHLLTGVWEGDSVLKIYIDTTEIITNTFNNYSYYHQIFSDANIEVGRHINYNPIFDTLSYKGYMSNLILYNRSISKNIIKGIYTNTKDTHRNITIITPKQTVTVNVYPTLISDKIIIESPSSAKYKFYNTMGQTISVGNTIAHDKTEVNSFEWPVGTYILKFDDTATIYKFIKL